MNPRDLSRKFTTVHDTIFYLMRTKKRTYPSRQPDRYYYYKVIVSSFFFFAKLSLPVCFRLPNDFLSLKITFPSFPSFPFFSSFPFLLSFLTFPSFLP